MNNITVYTKGNEGGFLPVITCGEEEIGKILELYKSVNVHPRSHYVHENGREEYFLQ